ncbi:MAG: tandem-95 repeat protein, partial [Rubrivivax sp.]
MRSLPPPPVQRPIAEAMEPRVLYSADFAPAAFMPTATDASHQRLADDTASTQTQATPGTEIVFVDARVPDQARLLADLAEQNRQGRPLEVVLIDANEDGIARITQTLADRTGISAVHLMSHGASGTAQLGTTALDEPTLATRAQDVAAWGQAFTQDADLLIYGCDVGAQAGGQALVQGLAALTGADVAASDDLTGSALLGGDWQLEVQSGHIEALLAPSVRAQSAFSGVLAAVPLGKADAVWATSGDSTPQYAQYDGATYTNGANTANTGQWTVVDTAASPKRDEVIAVGVTTSGTITGQVIKEGVSTLIPLTLGSGQPTNRQGFGIAYEQRSGDAMLVWNDGTNLKYSLYNGSTWTAAATIAGYTGAAPQHLQLVVQPGGDGMALVVSDANADDHALIWNGNSWGNAITLDTSGTTAADQTSIAVAFEAKSGHALVAYAKASDANVYFRVFDGSAWNSETAAGNYTGPATPQWLTLASDPTSNRIAMGLLSSTGTQTTASFSVWNEAGSQTWGNRTVTTAQNTTTNAPTVAVAYESKSGDLLAVYGSTSANTVNVKTLGNSGVWSATTTGPNAGGIVGALRLNSDPTTNNIMLGMQTTSGRLSFSDWSGGAWQATPVVAASNTGSSLTPAFSWTFKGHTAGNTTNTLWLGSNQANADGWDGVNSTTSSEVLALENPNAHYGAGATDGTFSHVFDLSAFGATGLDDIAWVSRDVVLSGSLTVHRGDVLFSVPNNNTTLTSVNSLTVSRSDVLLFSPTVAGDYSAGTFTRVFTVNTSLLGALGSVLGAGASVRGLALVEQSVTVGSLNGVTLSAGTIVFSYGNGGTSANDILSYKLGDLAVATLIEGDDINLDSSITGLEVVTGSAVKLGNDFVLYPGAFLISLAQTDSQVANNYANVAATDVIGLTVVRPTGANTAIAVATTLVQGSSVGITSGHIDSLALTLDAAPIIGSNGGGGTATVSVNENTTAVTTVTAQDIDPYAALTYSITGGADAAQFTIDSQTGVLRFTGAPDQENAKDSDKNNSYVVTVTASDGTLQDSQTLTVNVLNVNEAPVIVSGGGGSTANLVVLDNNPVAATVHATDPEQSSNLSYAIVGGLDGGRFIIDVITGELKFAPAVNHQTPQDSDGDNVYQVVVRAVDSQGAWDEQTLNISVQASNFAPVIDSNGGPADATLVVNEFHTEVTTVQATDDQTASTQLTYGIAGGADQALFSIDAQTGQLRFTAPPDTLSQGDVGGINRYEVMVSASDGQLTSYQTLTIDIQPYTRPVNNLAAPLSATEDSPSPLSGLSVTDPDAGSSPITVTFQVQHGTLSVSDQVASGLGSADIQYSADHRTVTLTGSVSAINATLADALGLVYLSDADFAGPETLSMTTQDGVNTGTAPPLTVTSSHTVTVAAVNDAPTAVIGQSVYDAVEQTDMALHNTGLRIGDVDAGTDSVQVRLDAQDGLISVNPGATGVSVTNSGTRGVILFGRVDQINELLDGLNGGTIVYRHASDTPPATDTLTLTINDLGHTGTGGSLHQSSSVTINLTAVNDAPAAVNDSAVVLEDAVLSGSSVLANDTDAEGDGLTAVLVQGPAHGTLVLNSDGSFTYTPDADFNGSDGFSYKASDGTDESNVATVTLTVNAVNDAPVAVDDGASVNEDGVLNGGTLLANDTDTEGNSLTAVLVSGTSHGTLALNANGTFTYTPATSFNGTDSFTYKAWDGTAYSGVATVTLTVNAVNDAPVAVDDGASVNEDGVLNGGTLLANDTDTEGDSLSAVLVSGPAHGALTLNANGTFTYTPVAHFNGTDSFTYQAWDGTAYSGVATVTLTVNAVNDAPAAVNDSASVNEDGVLNGGSVLANDTDAEGDSLSAVLVSGPTHGSLNFNSDGSYTYTPTANFNGTDSFTYQANDGADNSGTAMVTITINAVNDAPVIGGNALSITQGGTAEPTLVVTDVDNPDADLLISASAVVGGHFAQAGTGATLTQFTMADLAAHQVVFVHDNSSQAPSYVLSASDGQASTAASTVQASFSLTPP